CRLAKEGKMPTDKQRIAEMVGKFIKVSCAQNMEDIYLRRLFPKDQGFYVDVGAAHPVQHSVTKIFYDRGWCGINVEPHPQYYDLLCQSRTRDTNLNIALSDQCGTVDFSLNVRIPEMSTLEIAHSEPSDPSRQGRSVLIQVNTRTLADICQEYCGYREIDFLKIDVEGHERFVLKGADWERWRPKVVIVEATKAGTQQPSHATWEGILIAANYIAAWFDGLNKYYVRSETSELLSRLQVPICVFDGIVIPLWYIKILHGLAELLPESEHTDDKAVGAKRVKEFFRILQTQPTALCELLTKDPELLHFFYENGFGSLTATISNC
ncbi:MAG: FkbM family methyltransferase, partial [Nitrososphaera sp.]|nr:FkbM family methyltransferase [Nitrososphaera sp.]